MIKGDKNMSKVKVQSMVDGMVFIDLPDAKFSRTWEHRGAVKTIDSAILEEAMYEPGVDYMFSQGMLALVDVDENTRRPRGSTTRARRSSVTYQRNNAQLYDKNGNRRFQRKNGVTF